MGAVCMRSLRKPVQHKSRALRATAAARFFCAAQIRGKCIHLGRILKRKAHLKLLRSTRNCFRSGGGWNGGVLHRRKEKRRMRVSRVWNFLSGQAIPKIPEKNGRNGSDRTRNREAWAKFRQRDLCNGKRFCTGEDQGTESTG